MCAVGFAGLAQAQSIYSCTDSKGRKLTSDRPIQECLDREQRELNPSGSTRRAVGPSLTAAEREQLEAQQRKEAEQSARVNEERRRNRALLMRYPDRAAHDREREAALKQVDGVMEAANKRLAELGQQRAAIDAEMEFYKKDPSKAPAKVRRQIAEQEESVRGQQRFINDQQQEKKRVNERFDDELVRLKPLWGNGGL
ncbi:DUF4124 domain-containing protein [Variovorax sp. HJSM1_2]|uniref:DUF4124 domain-containing protein n=1 Tax=Variovorax sp. HJSM1_2 TaxID=3366263 RepID=UPI003BF4DFD3